MDVGSCWIFGGNWNSLSYTLIQSIPNILNMWHVWWVCRPWKSYDICSFQELLTDSCDMGLGIIMLKHEVMAADEWHENGPQDLFTVSLCIQIDIDQMQLCSLSRDHVCLYHNPLTVLWFDFHCCWKKHTTKWSGPPSFIHFNFFPGADYSHFIFWYNHIVTYSASSSLDYVKIWKYCDELNIFVVRD
jgi:hypothetical protein